MPGDARLYLNVTAGYIAALLHNFKAAEEQNAALRQLVREAEWPDYPQQCPWCGAFRGTEYPPLPSLQKHKPDCPALPFLEAK
jgi:hypothetical protein